MLTRKMQFPVAARFVERVSGDWVPGLIHPAVEEHLLLWTRWQYRPRDEDRAEWQLVKAQLLFGETLRRGGFGRFFQGVGCCQLLHSQERPPNFALVGGWRF